MMLFSNFTLSQCCRRRCRQGYEQRRPRHARVAQLRPVRHDALIGMEKKPMAGVQAIGGK